MAENTRTAVASKYVCTVCGYIYDPELGVVFLHSAGDSHDDGTIWVYRHRRKPTP